MATRQGDVEVDPGRADVQAVTSPGTGSIRSTRSSGRPATRSSRTTRRAATPSSSATSSSPVTWSQNATNIVAQKYFRGTLGTPAARVLASASWSSRVVDTITGWGTKDGYFATRRGRAGLRRRAHAPAREPEGGVQLAGVVQRRRARTPRSSAARASSSRSTTTCRSILNWYVEEGTIFKGGSGSGINLSPHPLLEGAARRRRHRERPGQLHARRRRHRRHDQVRRQDAARREDGRS